MADQFSGSFLQYLPPDENRTRVAITEGMVVVDTNVLLDAYRYTTAARNELFAALRALKDRLWIPHQVALEFHKNRASVIASHGDSYSDISKSITNFRKKYEDELANGIREFANRVSLPADDQKQLLRTLDQALGNLQRQVNDLQARHGISERFLFEDPVLRELQTLLDGHVGHTPSADEAATARTEAERRVREDIPPGFKDSAKDDPCGDYLLWHQALCEVRQRSVPLVFVTRDSKCDWFLRIKGKMLGALPALVEEARAIAGVDFLALPTRSFLIHTKSYLNIVVSESTLKQTEALRRPAAPKGSIRQSSIHLAVADVDFLLTQIAMESEAIRQSREHALANAREMAHAMKDVADKDGYIASQNHLRQIDLELMQLEDLRHSLRHPNHRHSSKDGGDEVICCRLSGGAYGNLKRLMLRHDINETPVAARTTRSDRAL
jgi:rRNA-processing protein FCF1